MAGASLQDIRELMDFYESNREVRHIELRNDLHEFKDKVDKKFAPLEKSHIKAEARRETFRTWFKPVLLIVLTALVSAGLGFYVS